MAPDDDGMVAAARVLTAYAWGLNVETALDEVDCRSAAAGLGEVLAIMVAMSGLNVAEFLSMVRNAVLAERMRVVLSGAVT